MSRAQLRNLYQRQVDLGGMATGGLFSAAAQAGRMEYQEFRRMHPGLPRAQLSQMWKAHKMGMMGSALVGGARKPRGMRKGSAHVGGYSDMTPMKGRALVGGARKPKGVRHCMREVREPSGLMRCAEYMRGPKGSALVGGFPYQQKLFNAYKRHFANANATERRCAFLAARKAFEHDGAQDFRDGVRAALRALGLAEDALGPIAALKRPRARASRAAPRARAPAAPLPGLAISPQEALEELYGNQPVAEPRMSAAESAQLDRELEELGF